MSRTFVAPDHVLYGAVVGAAPCLHRCESYGRGVREVATSHFSGVSERELRKLLEQELELAAGIERELSVHEIAHNVAVLLEQDRLRVAEQFE